MQTIKVEYVNLNNKKITRNLLFHLSKIEVLEWDKKYPDKGGFFKYLAELDKEINKKSTTQERKDQLGIDSFNILIEMIEDAYGEKSEDGERFIKNKEVTEQFMSSLAYEALINYFLEHPSEVENFSANLFT